MTDDLTGAAPPDDKGRAEGGHGRGGLWDDAWARPRVPAGEPVRRREQWDPSRHAEGTRPPDAARAVRRRADVDSRGVGHEFRDVQVEPLEPEVRQRDGRGRPGREAPGRQRAAAGRVDGRPATVLGRSRGPDARALAPRRTVVSYGHRRTLAPGLALGAAALALTALVAFGWWFFTRPTSLAMAAVPGDARISGGGATAAGSLGLAKVEPGTYTFEVSRAGFETRTVTLEVGRWQQVVRTVRLVPFPQRLAFTSRPKGARVRVVAGDGTVVTGSTPCTMTAAAGTITVEVSKAGCRTYSRTAFLDSPHSFDLILDPKGQLVSALGSLAAGGAPKGVALAPSGREAWSAILNGQTSVEIFDLPSMRRVGGVDLGRYGAVEIVFNRAGTRAYASQMETAKVFEIDVRTRKVTREFKTGSSWTKVVALSPDEKRLYAANWSGNDVSVISLVSGELLKRIPTAKTPRGLWPTADGRSLYVAGFDRGEIQRVDLETWEVTTVFKSGGAMRHLVADEKRGVLYASDMGKDVVWVLDMKTGRTRKFCDTDAKPNTIDLTPDGKVLFISNRGANNPRTYYIPGYEWGTVLLYDTATGKPLDAVVGGNQCTALDVSEDGSTLVFSDFLDNRLRVYSVPRYETLASGAGGRFAAHFADLKKQR